MNKTKTLTLCVVGVLVLVALLNRKNEQANSDDTSASTSSPQVHSSPSTETSPSRIDKVVGEADEKTASAADATPSLPLSADVRLLAGIDGLNHNYATLIQALKNIGTNLNVTEVEALRLMLSTPVEQFTQMRAIEANAIKNDILDKLTKQTHWPADLGLEVAAMASDPAQDDVWRDYCVQFLQPMHERISTQQASIETAPAELEAIKTALYGALSMNGHESTAATALIGLETLAEKDATEGHSAILTKAVEMAADETIDSGSRLTALRMAVADGISNEDSPVSQTEVLEIARTLAQTGESDMLRSGALVTLGEIGSTEDRELLASFATSKNRQIAAAAKMGLKKLEARE